MEKKANDTDGLEGYIQKLQTEGKKRLVLLLRDNSNLEARKAKPKNIQKYLYHP